MAGAGGGTRDRTVNTAGGGSGGSVTQGSTPWTVAGTVTVAGLQNNALTDAELRFAPVPISVASLPLPAGAATAANQQTDALTDTELRASPVPISGTVTVQDGGNVITVDATNLDIRDLTFAADKVDASGTVLGAGNNNIGDVDVASLPTFGAGQATYLEDTAHTTGDRGVFVLGVENSAGTILAPAGDYTPIATDPRGFVIAGVTRSPGGTIGPIDIALLVDNTGSPTASPVGAFGMLYDGTNWDMARGTAADGALVNLGANNDVTVSGTVTIQDGGNVISVDATDLDIRDLVFATDKVDASGTVLGAGTNNIGDVDIATIAAGTTRIGGTYTVSGQIIDNDGDVLTVKVAHLDMTTATTTDIVAAVATKKIRVIGWEMNTTEPATVTDVNFVTGAATTRVTGSPRVRLSADQLRASRDASTGAWLFETVAGEALRVTQTGATDITVTVVYIEV